MTKRESYSPRACLVCAGEYQPRQINQRWCSEKCRQRSERDRYREKQRAYGASSKAKSLRSARLQRRRSLGQCPNCHRPVMAGRTACAKHLAYRNAWMKSREQAARKAVLDRYGHACACCGESEEVFLSLDHINSDGHIQRKSRRAGGYIGLFRRSLRIGWPTDLQMLCFNCNLGRARNDGICPHQQKMRVSA